jgi:hypothetical protein
MGLGLTEKNGKEASYSLTAGPMYLELGLSTVSTSRAPISIYLLGLLARSSKLIAADFYSPFSFSPLGLGAPGLPGRNTLQLHCVHIFQALNWLVTDSVLRYFFNSGYTFFSRIV